MADSFGPVYEVTHTIDPDIVADFDVWLGQHIGEMLAIPGISHAAAFVADDDAEGRPRRVSQYHFDSDADLENYLAGPAQTLRESATEYFGGQFTVSRRVLHESDIVNGTLKPVEICLNCGTTLSGQYCGNCGQRARSRLISIWELLREAFGDLLELDSRLWLTLIPLTIRPGKLTRDYLEGRRARYMPPFRTYLVLSIIFFLVAFFDPKDEFSILFDAEPDTSADTGAEAGNAEDIRDEVMRQLDEDGVVSAGQREDSLPADVLPRPDSANEPEVPADGTKAGAEDGDGIRIRLNDGDTTASDDCDTIETDDWPGWLASRLTPERLKVACERITADNGKIFLSKLLDNVPAALIALLPLMALILKVLYPLSKRYYVEHVLFVVHIHAFVFLILSLQILFTRFASLVSLPDRISTITTVAVSLYIPVYFFKAMRHVYEQHWSITFMKYVLLLFAYLIGLMVILVLTAAIAAFTI